MFTEFIEQLHAIRKSTKQFHLLAFFIALVCALTIHPAKAHAQIIGELKADIPFQFYAGTAELPAGEYVVRMLDNSNLKIMEISSADGATTALFQVQDTRINSAPRKGELVFNKYGDLYFLTSVFDQGNPDGSEVPKSKYEKRVSQTVTEAQKHVPADHRGQQGS
jgi:hypothetical protein